MSQPRSFAQMSPYVRPNLRGQCLPRNDQGSLAVALVKQELVLAAVLGGAADSLQLAVVVNGRGVLLEEQLQRIQQSIHFVLVYPAGIFADKQRLTELLGEADSPAPAALREGDWTEAQREHLLPDPIGNKSGNKMRTEIEKLGPFYEVPFT